MVTFFFIASSVVFLCGVILIFIARKQMKDFRREKNRIDNEEDSNLVEAIKLKMETCLSSSVKTDRDNAWLVSLLFKENYIRIHHYPNDSNDRYYISIDKTNIKHGSESHEIIRTTKSVVLKLREEWERINKTRLFQSLPLEHERLS